jgi:hypothetical protein
MRGRAAGFALFLAVAVGLAAAGYRLAALERELAAQEAGRHAFERQTAAFLTDLSDLRAAQQAYVAAGQAAPVWMERSDALIQKLTLTLINLKELAGAPESDGDLGAAAQALDNFSDLDGRVREYARNGQLLMASDVIFGDGLEMTRTAARHAETALTRETDARDRSLAALRRQQLLTVAAAAGAGLLVILYLALRPSRVEAVPEGRADASSVKEPDRAEAPSAQPERRVAAAPPPSPPVPVATTAADLTAAAALCTDLARATDSGELPFLLARAAKLLEASGLVVWLADASGQELKPLLSHGYDAAAMARMPALPRMSDNATAAAFRNGTLGVVAGKGAAKGAVIAPLVAPAGCAGVVAIELPTGREVLPDVQALAGILAAQLVVLVAGTPAAPRADPEPVAASQA